MHRDWHICTPVLLQGQDAFSEAKCPQTLCAVIVHVLFRPAQQRMIISVIFNICENNGRWINKDSRLNVNHIHMKIKSSLWDILVSCYLTGEALSSLKELKYRRLCNKEQSHGWKDLKNGLRKTKNKANSDLITTEKISDGTLKHDTGRILTSDDYWHSFSIRVKSKNVQNLHVNHVVPWTNKVGRLTLITASRIWSARIHTQTTTK